ncbi:MAG: flippase-like domain-containing protein [Chloroflexi bacterium]|nr:flippase-like domain-containing protein [Chloroflexota bacterium]
MTRPRMLLGVAISIALLVLALRAIDPRAVAASLANANFVYLVPAVLVYFVGVWLRGIRWGMLLGCFATLAPARLFRAVVIGFAVNDVTPFRLGEVARAYLVNRWERVPVAGTMATIVVERLFDGLTLCGTLAIARLWMPESVLLSSVAALATAIFVAGIVGAYVAALWPSFVLRLLRLVLRPAPPALRERLLGLFGTFLGGLTILRRGRLLLVTSVLSSGAWVCEAVMYYIVMLGFGFNAGFLSSLLGMVAANFGSMVPSAPGYVGTFDAPLQTILTELFAVDRNTATAYTGLLHLALLVPVVLLGLYFIWREGLSLALLAGARPATMATAADSRAE